MNHVVCRPALLTAAALIAFPTLLPAQTGATDARATPDNATPASPCTPGAARHRTDVPASAVSATRYGRSHTALATMGDRDFLRTAAGTGMYGVLVSRLAN